MHKRNHALQRVNEFHRFYDALQYPLIFWKGQEGYKFYLPQVNPLTGERLPRKYVSCMDFYAYHIMPRLNNYNYLLYYRDLLSQFLVDVYAKIEAERLLYILTHQNTLRAKQYIHLQDAIALDADVNPNNLGQRVILPSSFINSPRYLAEYTQVAFTYVRNFKRPDLFVTFTCNPTWEEISRKLYQNQKATDRHDLIARVFKKKNI